MKLVLNGWIRAALDYSEISDFGDPDQFYLKHHKEFNSSYVDSNSRIKQWKHADKDVGITYFVTFGYTEFGVEFNVDAIIDQSDDRALVLKSLLAKAILGYKNLKEVFLRKVCPKSAKISVRERSERVLITTYNLLNDLDKSEKEDLIKTASITLAKHAAYVRSIQDNEEKTDNSDLIEIRMSTAKDFEREASFDFYEIAVVWDNLYLFVEHHLFGTTFNFDDPSLAVSTVAKWGFFDSLKLHDIYYEMKYCGTQMLELRKRTDEMNKKLVPYKVNLLQEDLIKLEKFQGLIDVDLQEFTLLSNKILEGLKLNDQSKRLLEPLFAMRSLPDSLDNARSILELQKLGQFSGSKRSILEMGSDIKIIQSRFDKSELGITAMILIAFAVVMALLAKINVDISYAANFVQILTFVIAISILVLRFWPKR